MISISINQRIIKVISYMDHAHFGKKPINKGINNTDYEVIDLHSLNYRIYYYLTHLANLSVKVVFCRCNFCLTRKGRVPKRGQVPKLRVQS